MAASSSSFSSADTELLKLNLFNQIRSHEVALAELENISSSRPVYQKNGNIFFRTTVPKATTSEQRELDMAKGKLRQLN